MSEDPYVILSASRPPGARETGDGKAHTSQGEGKGGELEIKGISKPSHSPCAMLTQSHFLSGPEVASHKTRKQKRTQQEVALIVLLVPTCISHWLTQIDQYCP